MAQLSPQEARVMTADEMRPLIERDQSFKPFKANGVGSRS